MATAPFVSGFHGTGAVQRIHGVRPADPRLDPTRIPCGARAPPPQPRRALPAFPTRIQREPIAERSAGSPSHRARHDANASRKARAGRKGREDSGTARTRREGNGETGRERQPLSSPCTPFIPYSRLREKGRGRCARNGRKNIWGGGDGKGGGKKREPAPPSEARANPSRKRRHGRARQTLCRSLRRSLSQNPPRRNRGSFRQKGPRSAAPEKRPQRP